MLNHDIIIKPIVSEKSMDQLADRKCEMIVQKCIYSFLWMECVYLACLGGQAVRALGIIVPFLGKKCQLSEASL